MKKSNPAPITGRGIVGLLVLAAALGAAATSPANAQTRPPLTESEKAKRWAIENELASLATIERKLMIQR